VLLKGGHLEGDVCVDLLCDAGKIHRFAAARIPLPDSHGTGCTLSAAITAALALGQSLPTSIATAKAYLGETLRQSYQFHSSGTPSVHALNQGTSFRKNEA